jgi:hypothetical protein
MSLPKRPRTEGDAAPLPHASGAAAASDIKRPQLHDYGHNEDDDEDDDLDVRPLKNLLVPRDVQTRNPSVLWLIELLRDLGRRFGQLFEQAGLVELIAIYADSGLPRFVAAPQSLSWVSKITSAHDQNQSFPIWQLITSIQTGRVGWMQKNFPFGHTYGFFVVVWRRGNLIGVIFPFCTDISPQFAQIPMRIEASKTPTPVVPFIVRSVIQMVNTFGADLLDLPASEALIKQTEKTLCRCTCGTFRTRFRLDAHGDTCPTSKVYKLSQTQLLAAASKPPAHGLYRVHYLHFPNWKEQDPQPPQLRQRSTSKRRRPPNQIPQSLDVKESKWGIAVTDDARKHSVVFLSHRTLFDHNGQVTATFHRAWSSARHDLLHSLPEFLTSTPFSVSNDQAELLAQQPMTWWEPFLHNKDKWDLFFEPNIH